MSKNVLSYKQFNKKFQQGAIVNNDGFEADFAKCDDKNKLWIVTESYNSIEWLIIPYSEYILKSEILGYIYTPIARTRLNYYVYKFSNNTRIALHNKMKVA